MVTPERPAEPEDDPDRTDLIPRIHPVRRPDPRHRTKRPLLRLSPRGRHRTKPKKQPLWRELLILVSVAFLLTVLIQQFLGKVYSIPSGSMEQTLHGCPGCTGDRVLVDKLTYVFADPAPGDVVVFKGPQTWTENDILPPGPSNVLARGLQQIGSLIGLAPPNERDFVKRVIAIGGQTVRCCDEQNRVVVDGRPLNEPYIYWRGAVGTQDSFGEVTVPPGTLWVMGDNRNDSCDSRCQGRGDLLSGVVPVDNVIGKARFIVLPPSRWRGIGDHDPQQGGGAVALSAPAWQQGLPLGVGALAAWPTVWLSRRISRGIRPAHRQDRSGPGTSDR